MIYYLKPNPGVSKPRIMDLIYWWNGKKFVDAWRLFGNIYWVFRT